MTQIEKHQKAIKLLEAIKECEHRIKSHEAEIAKRGISYTSKGLHAHYVERVAIETDKKIRLKNYYERVFKL